MSTSHPRWNRTAGTLFGAVLCLAFVLHPFLLPLHLLQHEHIFTYAHGDVVHVHVEQEHGHAHGHGDLHAHGSSPAEELPEDGHEPHPAEDHLEPGADPPARPSLTPFALAPPPPALGRSVPDPAPGIEVCDTEGAPRHGPPRPSAPPRAPPAVV